MATEAGLRRLRAKYEGTQLRARPLFIDERSWTIFIAYVYEERPLREIQEREHVSLSRMRQVLSEVDAQLEFPRQGDPGWNGITVDSPIEDLGLSIRARNALHHVGCRSVQDVLGLDLSGSVPRVGSKTRSEVLAALDGAGFRHRALDRGPALEITTLARSLDRMQDRITGALRSVSKEVSQIKRQLEDWRKQ